MGSMKDGLFSQGPRQPKGRQTTSPLAQVAADIAKVGTQEGKVNNDPKPDPEPKVKTAEG